MEICILYVQAIKAYMTLSVHFQGIDSPVMKNNHEEMHDILEYNCALKYIYVYTNHLKFNYNDFK